jgi:hypothetical protein
MDNDQSPAYGTTVIATLLLLALAFAGTWIYYYVAPGGKPWGLLPWFGAAAVLIMVLAFFVFLFRFRRRGPGNQ